MKYSKINKCDIADGPGVRVSLFCSGCDFHCPGCFNAVAWDYDHGEQFTTDTLTELLEYCNHDYIDGLSLLGGEPLAEKNLEVMTLVAKKFKERFPDKSLWAWTGNEFKDVSRYEIMSYLDVLVVGRFELSQRDISKENPWRGSLNQRVVNVQESLKQNKQVNLVGIPNNK